MLPKPIIVLAFLAASCATPHTLQVADNLQMQTLRLRSDTVAETIGSRFTVPVDESLNAIRIKSSDASSTVILPRANQWTNDIAVTEFTPPSQQVVTETVVDRTKTTTFLELTTKAHRRILQGQLRQAGEILSQLDKDYGRVQATVALRLMQAALSGETREAKYLSRLIREMEP